MKYFTTEWWSSDSYSDTPGKAYAAYIESIRPSLSPDLLALLDTVYLHDSKVRHLDVNMNHKRTVLLLDGYVNPWTPEGADRARRISLQYENVRSLEIIKKEEAPDIPDNSVWIPEVGEPIDHSDLGYDEIELLDDGSYEHRMLFASGIEMQIRFGDLKVTFKDDI